MWHEDAFASLRLFTTYGINHSVQLDCVRHGSKDHYQRRTL